jgi:hypothetical protein
MPNVDNYIIQIATDQDFENTIQEIDDYGSNTFSATVPFYSTQYWWRVAADMGSCMSGYTEPRSVTTKTEPPMLLNPGNDLAGVNIETNLWWGQVASAEVYHLQLDDNEDFSSPIIDQTGLTSNTFDASLDNYNSTYYWRVNALDAPCLSPWSQTFSFRTKYEAPEIVSPYNGEDCVSLLHKFQWKPVDGASQYTLQIAADMDFDNLIYNKDGLTGVSHEAPLPDHLTQYYWRVRAEDDNVGYYSDPAVFTTTLLPPETIAPEQGDQDVAIDATFEWSDMLQGTQYHFQLADNQGFDPVLLDREFTDQTSYDFTLPEHSTQYYWRISATFSNCSSSWSQPIGFRTELAAPELVDPADLSTEQPVNIMLSWKSVKDGELYDVVVASDEDFENIVGGHLDLPATSLLVKDLESRTKYYWKVKAENDVSDGDWSDVWEFTTGVRGPDVPQLIHPEHRAEMVPVSLTFTWEEAARAETYNFTLATDDDFGQTVVVEENIEENFLEVKNLEYYQEYYWRVQAANDSGSSAWSEIRRFRTIALAPSDAPELWTPLDGTDNLRQNLEFTWYAVPRAWYYHLQIATDPEFQNIEQEEKRVWDTKEKIFNLPLNTEYFWRVRGINEAGEGPWSDYWTFETYDPAGVDDGENTYFNVNVFPNPTAGQATFSFDLTEPGNVNIKIYNSIGEMVATIVNEYKSAGSHNVDWNTESLESGIYIYSLISGDHSETGQIVIAK